MKIFTSVKYILLFSTIFILCGLAEKAFAGLVMEQVRYEKDNPNSKEKGTIYIEDGKMKFVEQSGKAEAVFDMNKGNMIQIDHENKRYVTAKPEEYFELIGKFTSKMQDEIKKQLEQLPPEQRAGIEAKLKQQGMLATNSEQPKKVSLKKAGKETKIAGYESEKYEVYEDGELGQEIWTSKGVGYEKEINIQKMSEYMREIKKISQNIGGAAVISDERDKVYKEIYESGFPMKTIDYSNGSKATVEEITKVTKSDIPASAFQPPSNYKKYTLEEMIKAGSQPQAK